MNLGKTLITAGLVLLLVCCATPTAPDPPTFFQIDYTVHLKVTARVINEETKAPLGKAVIRFNFDEDPRVPDYLSSPMTTNRDGWAEHEGSHRFGGVLHSEHEEVDFLFVVHTTCEGYEPKRFSFVRRFAPNAGLAQLDIGTIELRPIASQSEN